MHPSNDGLRFIAATSQCLQCSGFSKVLHYVTTVCRLGRHCWLCGPRRTVSARFSRRDRPRFIAWLCYLYAVELHALGISYVLFPMPNRIVETTY
jgi:hypothetical protein